MIEETEGGEKGGQNEIVTVLVIIFVIFEKRTKDIFPLSLLPAFRRLMKVIKLDDSMLETSCLCYGNTLISGL